MEVAIDEPDDWDDEELEVQVAAAQAEVEAVLLAYVPEGAEALHAIYEYWKGEWPVGSMLLVLEFGARFLMPELTQHKQATDVVRRVYQAAEQLLASEVASFHDAAYFGLVESLGVAVRYLAPEDVGPLVAEAIKDTYPGWQGGTAGEKNSSAT